MKINKILIAIFILSMIPTKSYAYLDPGSGSILLSVIVAMLGTIAFYWRKFKIFIKNLFIKQKKNK
jgi:hypothetical protein